MELVSVWIMLTPLPSLNPVETPDVRAAVQLNVVPAVELLSAIFVVPPEQNACNPGVVTTFGMGFTVMVTAMGAPGHPSAVGVMV